ncbi:hypothetical protein Tco_1014663 [Tanacetum coccineum]
MSLESTSSGTPRCLLTPSSKVKFQYHESNIAYNNAVAFREHHEPLFQPMLNFLSNYSICTTLTKEPLAMYVKYLKDFWYTAEVDDTTKDILFSLSLFENQLSFTHFDFLTAIGLTNSKSVVPLPPKRTVRGGLATLGLADKDKPSLTSTKLGSHDQMNFSPQTIAYCLIFGLEINIGDIIFKDLINKLQNGKKNRETNTPSAFEVSLTSHMLKVAKLSKDPNESLILPSREVNAEATANKSQSRTNVQPLSQPKAPTAKKSKKKKIPSSTQPKVSNDSREMNPPSITIHLQATKELVVTAIPTQSLEAFVTAEVLTNNQLKAADITESPYDIESEIKVVKSFFTNHFSEVQDQTMNDYEESAGIQEDSDSNLQSMPDDDLRSVSGFEAADSDDTYDNKVSHSAHTSQDDISSTERLSIPDHLDHIFEEVNYLHSRLGNMESSFVQTVFDEIKSSLPAMITNALKEQLLGILSTALKNCLSLIVNESLQTYNPAISEQFLETQAQLNKKGEHKTAENITPPEPSLETQGEHAYKESTLLISDTKVNKESAIVLYNPKKDLVDLTTTEQDSEDDDDLDKKPLSKRFKIMHPIPNKRQPLVKQFTDYQRAFGPMANRLGLPPPLELATFGLTAKEKKRKRVEFIKEMFVTEDVRVNGMNRIMIPSPGVVPIEGLVIKEPESGIFYMNRNKDVVFQRESKFHLTPTVELIHIQNQIKVNSEIASEMYRSINYVIEARDDCIEARKTVQENLDNLG